MLRFADELADDNSRFFSFSRMPEYSKLFHAYSQSLHSVNIKKMENEDAYFIQLRYFLDLPTALCEYKKIERDSNGEIKQISISLIREIINRTIKMECERRYCTRFFLPYFILKHIKVEIEIDLGGFDGEERIAYTLEESGYPDINLEQLSDLENRIAELEKYITSGDII